MARTNRSMCILRVGGLWRELRQRVMLPGGAQQGDLPDFMDGVLDSRLSECRQDCGT